MDLVQKINNRPITQSSINDRKDFEEDLKRSLQEIQITLHSILYQIEAFSRKIIERIEEGKEE